MSINQPCGKALNQLLKERAYFVYYRDGNLVYKTDSGFCFQVPITDCDQAQFKNEDRAMFFLRWIRPAYAEVLKELNPQISKQIDTAARKEPKNPMSESTDEFERLEGLS